MAFIVLRKIGMGGIRDLRAAEIGRLILGFERVREAVGGEA